MMITNSQAGHALQGAEKNEFFQYPNTAQVEDESMGLLRLSPNRSA